MKKPLEHACRFQMERPHLNLQRDGQAQISENKAEVLRATMNTTWERAKARGDNQ